MAWCQHLPMGLGPGTPPLHSHPGRGLSCPFVAKGVLLGVASTEVPSRDLGVWSPTHLWGLQGKKWAELDPGGSMEFGATTTPQCPALPPHCSHVGALYGGAIPPPPSQSLLSRLWAERGGQQRYLFISFIYLIFFFFGVESDRWRRVPGEPALPQCRRMPITVSHVIAAARDVPSPYGLA